MERILDVAVIGGGPAGLAAGLYAARGGAKAAVFEALFPGGQAALTERIENYPGFPEGIEGMALGEALRAQAERFGAELRAEDVNALRLSGGVKEIETDEGLVKARAVILAMGASPRKLGIPREEQLTGAGVSYCATCDGALYQGKPVAVVGGGDTALADAVYLSRFASRVYLIHRRDALRGNQTLQKQVFALKNVEILWDSVPDELLGEPLLSGLRVKNVKSGEPRKIEANGLFVAVGIEPRTALVADQLALNPAGSILTDAHMRASLPGVYAAGDVRNTPLRQVVTAVADGAIAATTAMEELS